ncbi:MAG: hypothetical protein HXX08_21670 [Chloroflexi bacterium]|uniref:Uncharacterized protein n=1 Tax=Candidatus Chlorohelix allophototropha TaxID=3003348 RepID=A0A8T7M8U1_9CHLR|nr:hypothetical protein [Chloroflexota bacterium]WJW68407.1 hypothetical protein OZ401_004018 [Chloroflexota bacterium L227-S17]
MSATPALFKIELRLEPHVTGLQELENWPSSEFTPDFIVATSGSVRVEMNGLAANVPAHSRDEWLPDYLGGFALSLGRAAQKMREGAHQSAAHFVDEPVKLVFSRSSVIGVIHIEIEAEGQKVAHVTLKDKAFYAEIRRSLDDFLHQLLQLNPSLVRQPDVSTIKTILKTLY